MGYRARRGYVVSPKVFGKSLSRLETLQSTPLFSNFIFYCASKWARSAVNRSKCEKSILRTRGYSFKHSGNSRGRHRGPENMHVFWQSGLKMRDFGAVMSCGDQFSKKCRLRP